MKYNLHLFLCVDGCVCIMLGIGPGLVSMSPLRRSIRYVGKCLFCGNFCPFMCFVMFCFMLVYLGVSCFVWLGCFVFLLEFF